MQTIKIPKDHSASVLYTAVDVKFLCSVVCMVASLSGLCSLLGDAQILTFAAVAEKKSRQTI